MGVLNVTPDSFSDGGRYDSTDAALRHAEQMVSDGADVIDVGPESTRPGAASVEADEQIRRSVAVIRGLRRAHPQLAISIDTRSALVASAALDAGADIINDVSAGRDDPGLLELAAARGAGVILMHMQGDPRTMQVAPTYDDVVVEVAAFLAERAQVAQQAGVARQRIVIDPGFGFGKTVEHNLALLHGLDAVCGLGYAVMIGTSRKSFLGKVGGGAGVADRLAASLASLAPAVSAGVSLLRVHDVRETKQFLNTLIAVAPGVFRRQAGWECDA